MDTQCHRSVRDAETAVEIDFQSLDVFDTGGLIVFDQFQYLRRIEHVQWKFSDAFCGHITEQAIRKIKNHFVGVESIPNLKSTAGLTIIKISLK